MKINARRRKLWSSRILGGGKDEIKVQQGKKNFQPEDINPDSSRFQSTKAETDSARISWLQWLANKSKLSTEKPKKTSTLMNKKSEKRQDPFLSLLSTKLNFPGNGFV